MTAKTANRSNVASWNVLVNAVIGNLKSAQRPFVR